KPLEQEYGHTLTVVREASPSKLKGILGTARVIIGSRFHALVGALSQAVPSVAVGWSHKYEMLLSDYGCPQCRLTPSSTDTEIHDVMGLAIDDRHRRPLIDELRRAGEVIRDQVCALWHDVDCALGIVGSPQPAANLDIKSRNAFPIRA